MRKNSCRRFFSLVLLIALLFVSASVLPVKQTYAATGTTAMQTASVGQTSSVLTSLSSLFKYRLNKTSASGYVGDTTQLYVIGTLSKVTWESSDPEVADVSSYGRVTMKAPGTAVITATVGKSQVFCAVTVAGLAEDEITLNVGDLYPLTVQNSNAVAFWFSSDKDVATVDLLTGEVSANAVGTTTIMVCVGGHLYTVDVTVEDKKYTVTYHASVEGAVVPEAETVKEGKKLSELDGIQEEAQADGYSFEGWYLDEACTEPVAEDAVVTADTDLYAKLDKLPVYYTVTYKASVDGAELPEAVKVLEGTTFAEVTGASAALDTYTFEGWYLNAACTEEVTEDAAIDADTDLYAKLVPIYHTVTYHVPDDVTGAVVPNAQEVHEGTLISEIYGVKTGVTADDAYFEEWYLDEDFTQAIAEDAVLTEDIDLYARMIADADQANNVTDHYGVKDVDTSYVMRLTADSAQEIRDNVKLVDQSSDENAEIQIMVTPQDGYYEVVPAEGFVPAHSYQLTVDTDNSNVRIMSDDGEVFNSPCKLYNVRVHKDEIDNLTLDDNIIYIKKSTINSLTGVLEDGVITTDTEGNSEVADYTGTFKYTGTKEIAEGDLVCIYSGVNPRTLTVEDDGDDSEENEASYVKITGLEGGVFSYEAADFTEIMNIPDMVPVTTALDLDGSATDYTMTISTDELSELYKSIDFELDDGISRGDILVISDGAAFDETTDISAYTLGKITSVQSVEVETEEETSDEEAVEEAVEAYSDEEEDAEEVTEEAAEEVPAETETQLIITYEPTTAEQITYENEVYQEQDLDIYDTLTDEEVEEITEEVETQALESGFAEETALYLTTLALQSEDIQEAYPDEDLSSYEIEIEDALKDSDELSEGTGLTLMGEEETGHVKLENLQTKSELTKDLEHYEGKTGARLTLGVCFDVVITPSTSEDNEEKKIKIEVDASFAQEIMINFNYSGDGDIDWFEYIYELDSSVDLGSYTGLAIEAKIYTSEDKDVKVDTSDAEKWKDAGEAFKNVGTDIKKQVDEDEQDARLEELGSIDSDSLSLTDRYQELLQNETDYLDIINLKLFEDEFRFCYGVVVLKTEVDAVLSANVNISLGLTFEYAYAKTFGFHAKFSTDDGMEQLYGYCNDYDDWYVFEAYAMGVIGLRAGLKLTIALGIIDTDLCSIELSGEAGVYAKLYAIAYFKVSSDEDASFTGAALLDTGLYIEIGAKAQVWNDTFKKEVELYSEELPAFYLGSPTVILGFHDDTEPEPEMSTSGNTIYFTYDKSITEMNALDLRSGVMCGGEVDEDATDEEKELVADPLDFGYPIDLGNFGGIATEEEDTDDFLELWLLLTNEESFFENIIKIEKENPFDTEYNFEANVSITNSDGDATATWDSKKNEVVLKPGPKTRCVEGKVVLTLKKTQPLGDHIFTPSTAISRTLYFSWKVDEELTDIVFHYNDAEDVKDETVYTMEDVARSGYYLNVESFFDKAQPVREGYTFLGWTRARRADTYCMTETVLNTGVSGYGRQFDNNEINVYALWKPDPIYVNGNLKVEVPSRSAYPFTGDAISLSNSFYGDFTELPCWTGYNVEFRKNSEGTYELYYDDLKATDMAYFTNSAAGKTEKAQLARIQSVQNMITQRMKMLASSWEPLLMDTISYGVYTANEETNTAVLYGERISVTIEPGDATDQEAVTVQALKGKTTYSKLLAMTDITKDGYYIKGFTDLDTNEAVNLDDRISSEKNLSIIWAQNRNASVITDYYIEDADGEMQELATDVVTEDAPTWRTFYDNKEWSGYTLDSKYTENGAVYEKLVVGVENGGSRTWDNGDTIYTVNGTTLKSYTYSISSSEENPTHLTVYYMRKRCKVTYVDDINEITFSKCLGIGDSLDGTFKETLAEEYPDATYYDTGWCYKSEGSKIADTAVTDDGAAFITDCNEITVYHNPKAADVTVALYCMKEDGTYGDVPDETKALTLATAGADVSLTGVGDVTDEALKAILDEYRNTYFYGTTPFYMDHISLSKGDVTLGDVTWNYSTNTMGGFERRLNAVKFGSRYGKYEIAIYVKRLPVTLTLEDIPVYEDGMVTSYKTETISTLTGVAAKLPEVDEAITIESYWKFGGDAASFDYAAGTVIVDSQLACNHTNGYSGSYFTKWYLTEQPVTVSYYYSGLPSETKSYAAGEEVTFTAPEVDDMKCTESTKTITVPKNTYRVGASVSFVYEQLPHTLTLNVDGVATDYSIMPGKYLKSQITECIGDDPEKEGYVFVGWTTTENDESTLINLKTMDMPKADLTLYAYFKPIATITLDVDGETTVITCETGKVIKQAIKSFYGADPEKRGYTFLGWARTKDDSSTCIDNLEEATGEDLTLYACYRSISRPISWDLDGGYAFSEWDTLAVHGETILLPEVQKTGCYFLYWQDQYGVRYTKDTRFNVTNYKNDDVLVLTAVWAENEVHMYVKVFDRNKEWIDTIETDSLPSGQPLSYYLEQWKDSEGNSLKDKFDKYLDTEYYHFYTEDNWSAAEDNAEQWTLDTSRTVYNSIELVAKGYHDDAMIYMYADGGTALKVNEDGQPVHTETDAETGETTALMPVTEWKYTEEDDTFEDVVFIQEARTDGYTLPTNMFKEGYTFLGWYTWWTMDDGTVIYDDKIETLTTDTIKEYVDDTGTINLRARWTPTRYTITLDISEVGTINNSEFIDYKQELEDNGYVNSSTEVKLVDDRYITFTFVYGSNYKIPLPQCVYVDGLCCCWYQEFDEGVYTEQADTAYDNVFKEYDMGPNLKFVAKAR